MTATDVAGVAAGLTPTDGLSRDELRDAGRRLRKRTPRSSQAGWTPPADRDAVALLQAQDARGCPSWCPSATRGWRRRRSPSTAARLP